ncbi:hypothetical protein, partial [Burkholderia thailandensis]|uniref:hypothetical protein n=1 Tax=Burkholderia thailandensis TaxID=57975 RepID=UPI001959A791
NSGSCISSIPRIGLSAQGHEHDISNAPLAKPVYTVPKINSLLALKVTFRGVNHRRTLHERIRTGDGAEIGKRWSATKTKAEGDRQDYRRKQKPFNGTLLLRAARRTAALITHLPAMEAPRATL